MEAMIASGQATRSDLFIHRVIVTPACMEKAPAEGSDSAIALRVNPKLQLPVAF